jgi:SHS2 domain-containing protein
MASTSGYRERPHTADWELEAWAPDLPGLLEQAARGMYALAGAKMQEGPRQARQLELVALDGESLLVQFLEELLYLQSMERLAFDEFQLDIDGWRLRANLAGAPLAWLEKEIKAVTFHNLRIEEGRQGFKVRIVFDV